MKLSCLLEVFQRGDHDPLASNMISAYPKYSVRSVGKHHWQSKLFWLFKHKFHALSDMSVLCCWTHQLQYDKNVRTATHLHLLLDANNGQRNETTLAMLAGLCKWQDTACLILKWSSMWVYHFPRMFWNRLSYSDFCQIVRNWLRASLCFTRIRKSSSTRR